MEYTKHFEFAIKEVNEETGRFEGYASTFGNVDLQGDRVVRGAFTETIKQSKGKVPVLMGHSGQRVVGFGTDAAEDDKGLWVAGEFTLDSDDGRNAYAIARHASDIGHKLGLSIGYGIRKNGSEWNQETGIRELKALDLYEYSIAPVPANTRARVTRVKSDGGAWTEREFEQYLREAGLSREAAKRFVLRGFGALGDQRDVDEGGEKDAQHDEFMARLRMAELEFNMKGI